MVDYVQCYSNSPFSYACLEDGSEYTANVCYKRCDVIIVDLAA